MSESDDPCAQLEELRAAKRRLVTGSQTTKARFRSAAGEEREVTYAAVRMSDLDAEIRRLESACAISRGGAAPALRHHGRVNP